MHVTSPIKLLEILLPALKQELSPFALCGGLAAGIYRAQPRNTADVDIALSSANPQLTANSAIAFLERRGISAKHGWIGMTQDKLSDPAALIIGEIDGCSVDFLLPIFPWTTNAVSRAQTNTVDFGFGPIPTVTPEDLILSKLFALSIEPNRFQDMDDIKEIILGVSTLDWAYLNQQLSELELSAPVGMGWR